MIIFKKQMSDLFFHNREYAYLVYVDQLSNHNKFYEA